MIPLLLSWGVPERFAKPLLIVGGVLLLVAVLGLGKCTYDRAIIRNHDAKQEAATAKADRKADATAADQRRADDARANTERTEINDAIEQAPPDPASRRAAYYECVRKQQDARRLGKPPADC